MTMRKPVAAITMPQRGWSCRRRFGVTGGRRDEDNENGHPRRKTRAAGVAISEPNGRRCDNLAGDRRDALGDRLLQLLHGERHGEVVRSGGVRLLELVDLLRLRGRHDDRHLGVGAAERLDQLFALADLGVPFGKQMSNLPVSRSLTAWLPSVASTTLRTPISLSERMMFFRTLLELSVTSALISMLKTSLRLTHAASELGGATAGGTAAELPEKSVGLRQRCGRDGEEIAGL